MKPDRYHSLRYIVFMLVTSMILAGLFTYFYTTRVNIPNSMDIFIILMPLFAGMMAVESYIASTFRFTKFTEDLFNIVCIAVFPLIITNPIVMFVVYTPLWLVTCINLIFKIKNMEFKQWDIQ